MISPVSGFGGAFSAARAAALAALLCLLASAALLGASLAPAEVAQQGDLRVSFSGSISPHALPREERAPIAVSLGGEIATTDGQAPPPLLRISLAINRNGRLDHEGLPICRFHRIQPASNTAAVSACPGAVIGDGHFSAHVALPEQAPFPSSGRVIAFNGELNGRPAILAHVFGTDPAPVSYTLPFVISQTRGRFGTTLTASLAGVTSDSAYVTGLSLDLGRSYRSRGQRRDYLSASCPAPEGFPGTVFAFARTSMSFRGGRTLGSTLTRSCRVRR
jgi:hypothetical protein